MAEDAVEPMPSVKTRSVAVDGEEATAADTTAAVSS